MGSRGKNYDVDELKQLCNSVLHVSQCPITVNGQRAEKYWECVVTHYQKHKPVGSEKRGRKSLEGKWGDVKHDVSKFIGTYKQVMDLQISGTNEEDTFNKAKELYQQNHKQGKAFMFDSCLWILKDSSRWGNPTDKMASKKVGKSQSKSKVIELDLNENNPSSPINQDSELEIGQSGNDADDRGALDLKKRPIGNKRAKEEAKRQKMEQEFMKESLKVQNMMATTSMARNEFNQGKGTLLKLLQIPTTNLAPRVQDLVARWTLAEAALVEKKLNEVDGFPARGSQQDDLQPEPHRAPLEDKVDFSGPNIYVPQTNDPKLFMDVIERQF